jgi:glycerol-3-phosphate acyltransferase PlsY
MEAPLASILSVGLAYLLGGIPFGLVLVLIIKGVDIRTLGSGNIGATNASRAFAKRWRVPFFAWVYLLDFGKGFVPVFWLADLAHSGSAPLGLRVLCGAAAIAGHCYSPYLRLKGGKGVATATGVLAALEPLALLVAWTVFGLTFWFTRTVALGSLALGVALALTVVFSDVGTAFAARWSVSVLAITVAGFLFYTHRGNLRRLLIEDHDR